MLGKVSDRQFVMHAANHTQPVYMYTTGLEKLVYYGLAIEVNIACTSTVYSGKTKICRSIRNSATMSL